VIRTTTVNDVAYVGRGVSGITERFIYDNEGEDVIVISATSDDTAIFGKLGENAIHADHIFTEPTLTIVRVGKAGTSTIVNYKRFIVTENVLTIKLREKYKKLNLLWLKYELEKKLIVNAMGDRQGQMNISAGIIKNIKIDVPDEGIQKEIADKYEKLMKIKEKISNVIKKLSDQLDTNIELTGDPVILNDVFFLTVGSDDGMTEKYAYNNDGSIPIYSGASTNNGILRYTNRVDYNPPDEYITWSISGKAGTMYLRKGACCLTRDCGVMIPKDTSKINLKWFVLTQEKGLREFSIGKGGLGRLKKVLIRMYPFILPKKTIQDSIVEEFEKLIELKNSLYVINSKIDTMFKVD